MYIKGRGKGQLMPSKKERVNMWSRGELKQKAKDVLRGSYWKALLVSVVISVAAGGSGGGNSSSISKADYKGMKNWYFEGGGWRGRMAGFRGNVDFYNRGDMNILPVVGIVAGIIFLIIMIVTIGMRIFLGYNLEVGGRRYFIQASQGDVNMGYLGHGFKKEWYLDIIKGMIWKDLINFLWYLLLIIPGIVKSYAYSMVPYILADNPNIGYKRALELSKQMTDGEKWDMWVLDLSFMGWYLLGVLALGIGVFFVLPYDNTTHGELYLALRQKAIENGICDYRELKLIRQLKEETEIF